MASFSNPKRRFGTILMALGLLALAIADLYRPLHHWLFFVYLLAFVSGLILNTIAWKEEKKTQQSR